MAVEHKFLMPIEAAGIALAVGGEGGGGNIPAPAGFDPGQSRDTFATDQRRQQLVLFGLGCDIEQHIGGEHAGREVGCTEQGLAHFFQRDAEFRITKPLAAERLRHMHAGQAEFTRQLLPHRALIAVGAGHVFAHFAERRPFAQKTRNNRAELFLFVAIAETHVSPLTTRAVSACQGGMVPAFTAGIDTGSVR